MIKIEINNKGRRAYVHVTGHANAAAKGHDTVCAAVSALVLTLWQVLKRERARGFEYRLCEGDALITFIQDKRTKPYMHTVMCGFDLLADMYPQYVCLHV